MENKTAKNIGLIYKAKLYLNKDSLLLLYFSYIHCYINHANLVSGSTHRTCLRKLKSQQRHVLRLIHNKNRFYHSKDLFKSCEILNFYKVNLLNSAVFMNKIRHNCISSFLKKFEQPSHSYPIRVFSENYRKPQIKLHKCRFRISIRGPAT